MTRPNKAKQQQLFEPEDLVPELPPDVSARCIELLNLMLREVLRGEASTESEGGTNE
jgi:hypothetical protein